MLANEISSVYWGSNNALKNNKNINILEFDRSNTIEDLEKLISKCDFIFHLAGEVRPKSSDEEFKKSNILLEDNSIFIFTSPSSVECFFNQYSWNDSYKAIVIGKTTANYLPANINYKISSITSIEECIKLAKSELL